jgi:hypothetical protein
LFVLYLARNRTPESIRWLVKKGQTDRARREADRYFGADVYAARQSAAEQRPEEPGPSEGSRPRRSSRLPLQFAVAWSMAFANASGYGIITYTLAPNFFAKRTALITFIAALTGFVSGFFGLFADRLGRRILLLTGARSGRRDAGRLTRRSCGSPALARTSA